MKTVFFYCPSQEETEGKFYPRKNWYNDVAGFVAPATYMDMKDVSMKHHWEGVKKHLLNINSRLRNSGFDMPENPEFVLVSLRNFANQCARKGALVFEYDDGTDKYRPIYGPVLIHTASPGQLSDPANWFRIKWGEFQFAPNE